MSCACKNGTRRCLSSIVLMVHDILKHNFGAINLVVSASESIQCVGIEKFAVFVQCCEKFR